MLRQAGHRVRIIDGEVERIGHDAMAEIVAEERPDLCTRHRRWTRWCSAKGERTILEIMDRLGSGATLDKGTTVEQGIEAVAMTKAAGIKVCGSFMIGSPRETPGTVEATIRLIRTMKLDEVGLGVTTAYPGTDLFDTFGSDATGLDWDKALAFNPSAADHSDGFLKCTDLDDDQIRRLFHKAMREAVLYTPKLLLRRLSHLASVRHLGQSVRAAVRLVTS